MGISFRVRLDCASVSDMISHERPKLRIRGLRRGTDSLHLLTLVSASWN